MNDQIHCGDQEALVAYLYDDGEPAEREAMAAHVARCSACAEEIASLRATRTMLAAWAPPEAALGFHITRDDAPQQAATVLRPAAWWRQPLPAWAQAAAALLIFAAGMSLGSARETVVEREATPVTAKSSVTSAIPGEAPAAARSASFAAAAPSAGARVDLAKFEERLRALESARVQNASARSASPVDEAALLRQVQALIDTSVEQQQIENLRMVSRVVREFDVQRRYDLSQVENRMVRLHDTAGAALQQQSDIVNYLRNASVVNPSAGR